MLLLSIDPSMDSTGVAVWDVTQELVVVVDTLRQQGSDSERLVALARRLRSLVNEYAVEFAVIEAPTSLYVERKRSQTALKVLLAIGAITGALGTMVSNLGFVSVADWRGRAAGKDKGVAMRAAQVFSTEPRNDHEAEAVLIGAAFVNDTALKAVLTLAGFKRPEDELRRAWERYKKATTFEGLNAAITQADQRAFLRSKLRNRR